MSGQLRPLIPFGVYHVVNRGNELNPIVRDDDDRHVWRRYLETTVRRYRLRCFAYCLMDNHHHLLIQTPQANISSAMQYLHGQYARAFRCRPETKPGRLWQHRFRHRVICGPEHFLVALRYIAQNPVKAGLAPSPQGWPWSSHAGVTGSVGDGIVDARRVLRWFEGSPAAYEAFVCGAAQELPPFGPDERALFPTDPIERQLPRPPLGEILLDYPGDAGIAEAFTRHAYSLGEIALHLGRGRMTVGRRLVAHETAQMLGAAATGP